MRDRVLCSALVLLCSGLGRAQPNLAKNPGFEGPVTAAGRRFAVSPGDELRVETWVRGGEALVDEFGPFGVRVYRMQ